MREYEDLKSVVKNNITLSCGLKYSDDKEGIFTFTITETNEDICIWRLNEMLETLKKRLYQNGVESIFCTFRGFNEVTVKCYLPK